MSMALRWASSSVKARTGSAPGATQRAANSSRPTAPIEHVDVGVAGRPGVAAAEQRRPPPLEDLDAGIPQSVERRPQRRPPLLVGALGAAGGAAAVGRPAADAVGARPGALVDLGLVQRRVALQPRGQVGDLQAPPGGLGGQGVGQRPVGPLVVVAEGLAVEGDGHQAAPAAGGGRHPVDQRLAGDRLEGQGVGQAAVVHDEVDARGPSRSGARTGRRPGCRPGGRRRSAVQARFGTAASDRLARPASGRMAATWPGARIVKPTPSSARTARTDGFTAVSGSHMPGRLPPEPVPEVGQAPADLGADVALVGQRQDHVVAGLGDRPAGAASGRAWTRP